MYIHKEGRTWVIGSLLGYILLIILFQYLIPDYNWIVIILLGIPFLLILNFFRNPSRMIPKLDDHTVYAAADGKIVVIEEVFESEYFNDTRKMVSIFMNPLNVHCNRYPVSGKVVYTKYHPGKYLVAWHPKSSTENERNTVVVETPFGTQILMRQIAGALARRIVSYAKVNQAVQQGEDFGFIKFGSRVDLFFPLNTDIKVELQQIVKGNLDTIALIK